MCPLTSMRLSTKSTNATGLETRSASSSFWRPLSLTRRAATRALADKVLQEACEAEDVPWWRRTLVYWGVRVGGASHFGT